ncbi:hypothetical protein OG223_48180 [Streptomyces sp. NBC_01478]|uniref:hypothetical protein n=1 Tax=Streptomyces sp. NBC_01478 TaxID=2903882 RepID=UPI002E31E4AD|nr:hypothetical protein [Streptomyces sp. NBC_01478]
MTSGTGSASRCPSCRASATTGGASPTSVAAGRNRDQQVAAAVTTAAVSTRAASAGATRLPIAGLIAASGADNSYGM